MREWFRSDLEGPERAAPLLGRMAGVTTGLAILEGPARSIRTCEKRGSLLSGRFVVKDCSFCTHRRRSVSVKYRPGTHIASGCVINRYYDPSTGQFVSVDPLVGVTGAAYSYCGGNPSNWRDPSGDFSPESAQWGIAPDRPPLKSEEPLNGC
ncbi:MAG TPA: RHS repeat-associated core domain-containing protein [Acidimicrobiales bacterium]|nr:RHS repeat-associated core domain-containing protein [Acidimicrobiales bacterium]